MAIDRDQKIMLDYMANNAQIAKLAAERARAQLDRLAAKTALLAARQRGGETVHSHPAFRADVDNLMAEARQLPGDGEALALGVWTEAVHLQTAPAFQAAREAADARVADAEGALGRVRFLYKCQGETAAFAEVKEKIRHLFYFFDLKPADFETPKEEHDGSNHSHPARPAR